MQDAAYITMDFFFPETAWPPLEYCGSLLNLLYTCHYSSTIPFWEVAFIYSGWWLCLPISLKRISHLYKYLFILHPGSSKSRICYEIDIILIFDWFGNSGSNKMMFLKRVKCWTILYLKCMIHYTCRCIAIAYYAEIGYGKCFQLKYYKRRQQVPNSQP